MIDTVRRTVARHGMLSPGDKVIVALSGGADSVSLIDVLLRLSTELKITVAAAHINHNLRGDESLRDERFVRDLCKKREVELYFRSADIASESRLRGESTELCGRRVRYEFFSSLMATHGAKLATAHTASDSAETMLFNMARGASLSGLCSIPYVRDGIVRPLLDVTRDMVESYCTDNNLQYVTDSTNSDYNACDRNKLRLGAVKVLKEVNPRFEQNVSRLKAQLIEADSFICSNALQLLDNSCCEYGYDAKRLRQAHPALLHRAIVCAAERAGAPAIQSRHIMLCADILTEGGAVPLGRGYTAICTQGVFRIKADAPNGTFCHQVTAGESVSYGQYLYSFKQLSYADIVHKKLASSTIRCDTICNGAVIRTRRPGDTFAPIGRKVTKPLRRLQNELKIPRELRDSMLVIAVGSTVLWAQGIGTGEAGLPNDSNDGIYIEVTRGE